MFLKWPVDENGYGTPESHIIYIGLKNSMINPLGKHTIVTITAGSGNYNEF